MIQDPIDCYRIATAMQREYVFYEQQLRRHHSNSIHPEETQDDTVQNEPTNDIEIPTDPVSNNHAHDPIEDAAIKRINDALERAWEHLAMEHEDQLVDVPEDGLNLCQDVTDILQTRIAEVYPPPRITKIASEYKLIPGSAFDNSP